MNRLSFGRNLRFIHDSVLPSFYSTRQTQSLIAQSSVYLMLIGAMKAASDDLTFNWFGYVFLLMNNFSTAAQGVVIKQKLVNKVKSNERE